MTNFMVKSGTGSGRICFTNPATSGSGRISQKQIWYSPSYNNLISQKKLQANSASVPPVDDLQSQPSDP